MVLIKYLPTFKFLEIVNVAIPFLFVLIGILYQGIYLEKTFGILYAFWYIIQVVYYTRWQWKNWYIIQKYTKIGLVYYTRFCMGETNVIFPNFFTFKNKFGILYKDGKSSKKIKKFTKNTWQSSIILV